MINNNFASTIHNERNTNASNEKMDEIRVIVIEDHDLTRIGLVAALQRKDSIQIVGEAANGFQGLRLLEGTKPDVAIVDIGLPDIDGIEVVRRFKQSFPEGEMPMTKILMLTMHKSQESVLAALAAGADSYCMKEISVDRLAEALHYTYEGNPWLDPAIANIVLQQVRHTVPSESDAERVRNKVAIDAIDPEYQQLLESSPLTERELEILDLIVAGYSNSDIADKLYITVGTVKTHVRNILNKLCVDDRTQAAVRALRSGLIG
jgi:two-component system, NarL family, response regulator LiaR